MCFRPKKEYNIRLGCVSTDGCGKRPPFAFGFMARHFDLNDTPKPDDAGDEDRKARHPSRRAGTWASAESFGRATEQHCQARIRGQEIVGAFDFGAGHDGDHRQQPE